MDKFIHSSFHRLYSGRSYYIFFNWLKLLNTVWQIYSVNAVCGRCYSPVGGDNVYKIERKIETWAYFEIPKNFIMRPFMNPKLNLFSFSSCPIHRDGSSQPWPAHTHREDQTGLWAAHFHRLVPGLGPWLLEHWPPGAGHGGAGDLNFELSPLTFKPHCLTASWSKLPLDTYKMPISCLSGFNHGFKNQSWSWVSIKRQFLKRALYCPELQSPNIRQLH